MEGATKNRNTSVAEKEDKEEEEEEEEEAAVNASGRRIWLLIRMYMVLFLCCNIKRIYSWVNV